LIIHDLAEAKEELRNMLVGQNLVQRVKSSNRRIFDGIDKLFVLRTVSYKILPTAKDYKRIGESDTG
jgi:phosphoribosylamine--glycine ligase